MYTYSEAERLSDFQWFVDKYNKLFEKYGHKYIAIRNKKILGIYDNLEDGIENLTKIYPLGTFIIQECTNDESGYTNYFSSWEIVSIEK